MTERIFIIVLDSLGIGEMPDSREYGDCGVNTLRSIRTSAFFNAPNLKKLGFFNIDTVGGGVGNPSGSFGRMAEKSKGKDTTIGHWEIAGVISEKPLPVFPNGFPKEIIKEFEKETGRGTLCNRPYSGTEVIKDYGAEHIRTGKLIVYTSADSVFQVAAHTDAVPLGELYADCEKARKILKGEYAVGRVIARPFTGDYPYVRTSDRHDYSLPAPKKTMLDTLCENGFDCLSVGKISDIFAGRGLTESHRMKDNADGMAITSGLEKKDFRGLCFVNLVDFDMKYGHRRDIDGYAKAVTEFDVSLGAFLREMRENDMLIITADHGCDPAYKATTDHTREYVPLVIYGKKLKSGVNLGLRDTFADVSATVLEAFGLKSDCGTSFLGKI
jgi:phosphopentomutase